MQEFDSTYKLIEKSPEINDSSNVFRTFENGLFHAKLSKNLNPTYQALTKNKESSPFIASMIGKHLITDTNKSNNLRNYDRLDWITGILTFILIVLVFVKLNYVKRFREIGNALIGKRYVSLLSREGGLFEHKGAFELFIIFILSASLIGYRVIHVSGIEFKSVNGFIVFLQICFIITITYIIKVYAYKFIGFVFNLKEEFKEYIHNVFIINESLGLILFPLAVAICFIDKDYTMSIFMFSLYTALLFYLFRIFRGINIWSQYIKLSKIYLFLYFCTFEVLPMLVLIKLCLIYFQN